MHLFVRYILVLAFAGSLAGCAMTNQVHSELSYHNYAIAPVFLGDGGVGVLTPSAPTGQEADRQALGDALGAALNDGLQLSRVVSLPEMLSVINESGLAAGYSGMLAEYERTGVLERDVLNNIGAAGNVRYIAKLNLGNFSQSRDRRLSIAGIRLFETSRADIRLHLEIWDSQTGVIAWQGNEELLFAREGVKERPVSFRQVAEMASARLIERIGASGDESSIEAELPEALASLGPAAGT